MSLDTLSQLNEQIGQAWLAALPKDGWDTCELFWARAGEHTFCQTELVTGGQRRHQNFPVKLHPLLAQLRAAMSSPEQGCWLSLQGQARPDGTIELFYNWSDRYYFNGQPTVFDPPKNAPLPSEAMFLAELQRYPRSAKFWPSWLPHAQEAAPQPQQTVAPPPALGWVVQPETFGWPAMYGQLDECLRGTLRMTPELLPAIQGEQGKETQQDALRRLLDLTLACAAKTLGRSNAEVLHRMWQEWATRTGLAQPLDLSGMDLKRPLADMPPSDQLTRMRVDVLRVLRVLAGQMIATRFGTAAPR